MTTEPDPTPTPMPDLSALRLEVDRIDSEILALIERRSGLADQIAASKTEILTTGSASLIRADREATLLRHLIAKASATVNPATVIRIWRELIGQSLRRQYAGLGGLKIAISGHDTETARLEALATARFGTQARTVIYRDITAVITMARQSDHVGVISLGRGQGAWWARLLAEPKVRVFAALPQGFEFEAITALAMGTVAAEPSGNDTSLVVVESPLSDGEVVARWIASACRLISTSPRNWPLSPPCHHDRRRAGRGLRQDRQDFGPRLSRRPGSGAAGRQRRPTRGEAAPAPARQPRTPLLLRRPEKRGAARQTGGHPRRCRYRGRFSAGRG